MHAWRRGWPSLAALLSQSHQHVVAAVQEVPAVNHPSIGLRLPMPVVTDARPAGSATCGEPDARPPRASIWQRQSGAYDDDNRWTDGRTRLPNLPPGTGQKPGAARRHAAMPGPPGAALSRWGLGWGRLPLCWNAGCWAPLALADRSDPTRPTTWCRLLATVPASAALRR